MYFNYVRENSDQSYTILQIPFQGILTPVPYCMAKDVDEGHWYGEGYSIAWKRVPKYISGWYRWVIDRG